MNLPAGVTYKDLTDNDEKGECINCQYTYIEDLIVDELCHHCRHYNCEINDTQFSELLELE